MAMIRLLSFEPLGDARVAPASEVPAPTSVEPRPGPAVEHGAEAQLGALPEVAPSAPVAVEEPSAVEHSSDNDWHELVAAMAPEGVTLMILERANLGHRDSDQWTIRLDEDHFALVNDKQREEISALVERHVGHAVEVRFEVGELQCRNARPHANRRIKAEREAQAKAVLLGDANVRALLAEFDARLESPQLHACR